MIGKIIHGVVVLRRCIYYSGGVYTIQEVGDEMRMGLSIYGVAVMMGRYTPDSTPDSMYC